MEGSKLPRIGPDAFAHHLEQLGVRRGMHLAVHSRLMTFGRIEGGAQTVFDALRNAVGANGTLVFPTYTTNLGGGDVYDPRETPSYLMGALPEFIRRQPNVRRTLCPIHSHAVIGAKTEALFSADPNVSLGPGSSFAAMRREGFFVLLLGCSFQQGATFVHHVEAAVGVPYRTWLDLPRQVRLPSGDVAPVSIRYFGRVAGAPENDFGPVERVAESEAGATRIAINNCASYLVACEPLERCVTAMIGRDAYALAGGTP